MKGLMIKDLMCLRKQLLIFSYVVTAVIVISIMFVLSARFGNIALGNEAMLLENNMTEMDVKNLSTWAIILFMLLPVATVGDAAAIFVEDRKAGFYNVSAVMPLSVSKRVMARYITVLVMFGIGVGVDLVVSFVLSCLTDIISFTDFFGIIISAASLMSIYGALVIVFCFLFGHGKEDYAIVSSWMLIIVTAILINISRIKQIFMPVEAGDIDGLKIFDDFTNFFKQRFYILFVIALITMLLSYFTSVLIVKRKGDVI